MQAQKFKQTWTPQEEQILFQMHNQIGNRWLTIANQLQGKNDIAVKNHYYSKLRKSVRKINRFIHTFYSSQYKQFKPAMVSKLVQATQQKFNENSTVMPHMIQLAINIKNGLLKLQNQTEQQSQQYHAKALSLLQSLDKFNLTYKKKTKQCRKKRQREKSIGDLLQIQNVGTRKRNKSTAGLKRGQSIQGDEDDDQVSNSGSGSGMAQSWGHSSQSSLSSKSHSSNGSRSRSRSIRSATSSQNEEKKVIKLFDQMQLEQQQTIKQQNQIETILQQAGLLNQQNVQFPIFRTASKVSQQSESYQNDIFRFDDSEIQIRFLPPMSFGQFDGAEHLSRQQFNFE